MALIRTARKEKLPKGFSYPFGAEAISAALDGIPQFDNAELWFSWRDEFWVSRWRKRLQSRGVITLFRVAYSDYFGVWNLYAYSVPSEYTVTARELLKIELRRVRDELQRAGPWSRSFRASVGLSLLEADRDEAANQSSQATAATRLAFDRSP